MPKLLLLLDTNVLLFYLAAQVDLVMLGGFKRLSAFRTSDLQLLRDLVESFPVMITTPHVLTEVSNLVDQAPPQWRTQLIEAFRRFAQAHAERYEAAMELTSRGEFKRLALADTALLSLSKEATVATLDGILFQHILAFGGNAVHFQYLRGEQGGRF